MAAATTSATAAAAAIASQRSGRLPSTPRAPSGLAHAAHAHARHRLDHLGAGDAVDEVALASADLLLDQAVDVRLEAREAIVEVARELQVLDDVPVEPLPGNQERNPGRVRRDQRAGDAALEV